MPTVSDAFDRTFRVTRTDQREAIEESQRLRYQVYCDEHRILEGGQFPDGLERDQYDTRALHCLIHHRASGSLAGSARLVLPVPAAPETPFPVEDYTGETFAPERLGLPSLDRAHTGEPSRFVVAAAYRRRGYETRSALGITASEALPELGESLLPLDTERRAMPHLALGLIRALVQTSAERGLSHWFLYMDPALLRKLTRLGIFMHPVGEATGRTPHRFQPCWCRLDTMLQQTRELREDVWEFLTGAPAT
jgi:N-acyl amino acid synthase of PEP-CTERM/exosortase system